MVGLKNGHMLIVDIASGDVLEDIPAHDNELWSIYLMPDQVLCVVSYNNRWSKVRDKWERCFKKTDRLTCK
jgi:U3 small nucleolar RNA-associated protein 12